MAAVRVQCMIVPALVAVTSLISTYAAAESVECDHVRQEDRGRRCLRSCQADGDCPSHSQRCLCDGKCGKSCINPGLGCQPAPSHIGHGRVTVSPSNRFGAIASYSCEDGYMLVGLHARVCQGDGSWMGEAPRCEPNHGFIEHNQDCGLAPHIDNAVHSDRSYQVRFSLGTNLRYSCLPGFVQHKESVVNAWCVGGGVWVGPNMTCSAFGCQPPSPVPYAHLELPSQILVGSRVKYVCHPAFFLVGGAERTCLKDGSWDGREPSCHPARDCGDPGEVANGWREPGSRFPFTSRVTYRCNEGFALRGQSSHRECQANGEWLGELPECTPIRCGELAPPIHGNMIGSGTSYRSLIRFVCNNGYRLVGSSERVCQSEGSWSGQDTACEEISCGYPGPLWNGYLEGQNTNVGAVILFRCNTRTKFKGTYFTTECRDDGHWSNEMPQCLGQCQIPSIANGTVLNGREGVWVDHDFLLSLKCLYGLELNDTVPVSCNNGTWTVVPSCVPAPCNQPPPHIVDGHRVFFHLVHGSRARYYCTAGYKLVGGHRYLTCEYGKWSGTRPRCEESYCLNPGSIENGEILKIGTHGKFPFSDFIVTIKHGDRLEYRCKKEHRLIGHRGAACVNGKWSPLEKPTCIRTQHPIFNKLWHPFEEKAKGPMYY